MSTELEEHPNRIIAIEDEDTASLDSRDSSTWTGEQFTQWMEGNKNWRRSGIEEGEDAKRICKTTSHGGQSPDDADEVTVAQPFNSDLLHRLTPTLAKFTLAGKVAVSTLSTWPQGHAFSLLDAALVEALREADSGLPAWFSGPGSNN